MSYLEIVAVYGLVIRLLSEPKMREAIPEIVIVWGVSAVIWCIWSWT